jgi:hypothetical protein
MQIRMEFVESTLNYQKYRWRSGDIERTLYLPRVDLRFNDENVAPPDQLSIILSTKKLDVSVLKENESLRRENGRLLARLQRALAVLKDG